MIPSYYHAPTYEGSRPMRGADEQPGSMFSYASLKARVGRTTADLGQERLGGYGPPAKTVAGILPV